MFNIISQLGNANLNHNDNLYTCTRAAKNQIPPLTSAGEDAESSHTVVEMWYGPASLETV